LPPTGKQEGVVEQCHPGCTLQVKRQRDKDEVELPGQQLFMNDTGLVFAQVQLQGRKMLADERQGCRQQEGRDGGDHAERKPATERLLPACRDGDQGLHIADTQTRLGDDGPTGIREHYASVGAIHQADTEPRLKLLDGDAEGGLRNVAGCGGTAEMTVFVECDEKA